MENKEQNIFSGLWLLLSGLVFDSILSAFRTPPIHKDNEGSSFETIPVQEYDYDSRLDVRIIYQDDGDGDIYPVNQSFDDFFINKIECEKNIIIDSLKTISYDATSLYQLKVKMKYFLNEVEDLPTSYRNLNWEPLTEKAFQYIDETIHVIKEYILAQITNCQEEKPKKTFKQLKPKKISDKEGLESSWANRNPDEIKNLYIELCKKFIEDQEGQLQIFTSVFSGSEPPSEAKRIKWESQIGLKYFVNKLRTLILTFPPEQKGKSAFKFPPHRWVWVRKCFVRQDGTEFDYIGKEPKKPGKETKVELDKILNSLNL